MDRDRHGGHVRVGHRVVGLVRETVGPRKARVRSVDEVAAFVERQRPVGHVGHLDRRQPIAVVVRVVGSHGCPVFLQRRALVG